MRKIFSFLFIIFIISCSSKKEATNDGSLTKPTIAVVNYPLYYFAKSIGGDHITVYLPDIEGDPAFWKPEVQHITNFQNSELIFANGAGYASWMEKVSLPSSKIINTSSSFKDQWIASDQELVHSHGPEGDHSHKETAFTTWLNFRFASKQAAAIHEALTTLLPDKVEVLDKNFKLLEEKLMALNKRMQEISGKVDMQNLVASHPVYQYLEEEYGLKMISKHWEPDELPTEEMWHDLEELTKDTQSTIMVWEDEPLNEIKLKLEKLNILIAVFNPCANKPVSGDFIDVMNKNLQQLEQAING